MKTLRNPAAAPPPLDDVATRLAQVSKQSRFQH